MLRHITGPHATFYFVTVMSHPYNNAAGYIYANEVRCHLTPLALTDNHPSTRLRLAADIGT
jgi:hypothetical protein